MFASPITDDLADLTTDQAPPTTTTTTPASTAAAQAAATAIHAVTDLAQHPTLSAERAKQHAEQQAQQQAEYEAQYNAWKAEVEARVAADILTIRSHLGMDTVTEEAARDLYEQANGDPIEAIAMHLNPTYAKQASEHIAQQRDQDAKDIHDLQTCNLEVDPQTAIRRLRAVTNAKDRILVEAMRKNKEEKEETQRQEAAPQEAAQQEAAQDTSES